MDLTLTVTENTKLNVRVAIILETEKGFVFSQNKKDSYLYPIGGRAKVGENSVESAARELYEETGLQLSSKDFKLVSIIENFWTTAKNSAKGENWKIHEINFVFSVPKQEKLLQGADVEEINLHEIKKADLGNYKILPMVIKEIILQDKLNSFSHYIV